MKKRAKKNPRREEDSSTDHSCFVANVSVASMRDDKLVSFLQKFHFYLRKNLTLYISSNLLG